MVAPSFSAALRRFCESLRARSPASVEQGLTIALEVGDEALGAGEGGELAGDALAGGEDVVEGGPVLAEQALEAEEALLHLGQAARVGLGALGVAADVARDVREGAPAAVERLGRALQRGIERGGGAQLRAEARQLVAEGVVALVEAGGDVARHLQQAAGVAQAVALDAELFHLPGAGERDSMAWSW